MQNSRSGLVRHERIINPKSEGSFGKCGYNEEASERKNHEKIIYRKNKT